MYLWLWWSTCIHVEAANDSLKPGETLNYKATLCSKNAKYCLDFTLLNGGGEKQYLVVLNANTNLIVWMSDENQPVDKDSAVLSLNRSGVLKIESQRGQKSVTWIVAVTATALRKRKYVFQGSLNYKMSVVHH